MTTNAYRTIMETYKVLNQIKGFDAGYSSSTANDGYMLIRKDGRSYAVKITEMPEHIQNMNLFDQIDQVKYYI